MGTVEKFPRKPKRKQPTEDEVTSWERHLDRMVDQLHGPICNLLILGIDRETFLDWCEDYWDFWERRMREP